jgi:NAD(P)-dependent dehydrogenase (short-subunit alcohol dehydrogenase family)
VDPSSPSPRREVLVVTGAGGMGEAVARRIGGGRTVVFADFNPVQLDRVAGALQADGYDVHPVRVDVSSARDVEMLAATAAELGTIRCVVHTAGVSPVQATSRQSVDVDVVGTARVLDAFEAHVEPGTVAVCIASMAGTMTTLAPDVLRLLAVTPTDQLAALPVLDPEAMSPGIAYGVAKRANHARVQAASIPWGRRGGRVVSISPGVISTPMGQAELAGPFGEGMRAMIEMSGTRRIGTPDDIAAAVEFLVSSAASFITGTDLLVDGGVIAALGATPNGEG